MLVRNERRKLLANALDRASTACFAVGVLTPAVAATIGSPDGLSVRATVISGVIWLLPTIALHFAGRLALGGLEQ